MLKISDRCEPFSPRNYKEPNISTSNNSSSHNPKQSWWLRITLKVQFIKNNSKKTKILNYLKKIKLHTFTQRCTVIISKVPRQLNVHYIVVLDKCIHSATEKNVDIYTLRRYLFNPVLLWPYIKEGLRKTVLYHYALFKI